MTAEADDVYVAFPATPNTRGAELETGISKPFSQQPNPLAKANFISVTLAQWIQPLISLGARKSLDQEDAWPLCEQDSCESLERRFRQAYKPGIPGRFGLSPLKKALLATFSLEIFFLAVGCLAYVLGLTLQAYIAQALLEFLAGEENILHVGSGYCLMVLMTAASLLTIMGINYVFFSASRIGINMRSIVMDLIYQKSLRLSSSARQEYTSGEILTLMSVDSERVLSNMVWFPWMVIGPVSFVISVILLGFLFNVYAALVAAVVICIVMAVSVVQGDRIASLQRRLLDTIDERVRVSSETLLGIRVMKFYGWEDMIARKVDTIRAHEVKLLRMFNFWQVLNVVMLFSTPILLSGVTLGVYVLIQHTVSMVEAFTLIAIVNICRTSLSQLPLAVAGLSKAKIAYSRIESFMSSDELEQSKYVNSEASKGSIAMIDAQFAWPSQLVKGIAISNPEYTLGVAVQMQSKLDEGDTDVGSQEFRLERFNIVLNRGSLVMIVGKVGSGKSSLVNAILGEMPIQAGGITMNGELSYVSQEPWIRNSTLRDNILFEEIYDEQRYLRVLDATQLSQDLHTLSDGDQTEIGERGINLSGGQKARVAIARAIYRSRFDFLILDDPLSALDPHVAHAIFEQCIVGMAADKTRILVLNSHYDLLPNADKIVVMEHGAVVGEGSYQEIVSRFPDFAVRSMRDKIDSETGGLLTNSTTPDEGHAPETGNEDDTATSDLATRGRLIKVEDRVKGMVGWKVYKSYFDESGLDGAIIVTLLIAIYLASQTTRVLADWWPGHWARNMARYNVDPSYSGTTFGMWYLGIIVLCTAITIGRAFIMIETCMKTSNRLHHDLFRRVLKAPVNNYFDVTPVGRILNRFSNDLDQMDSILPQEFQFLGQNVSMALGSLIVSAFASYWIGVSYIPILFAFVVIGQYFKKTSRELKRLEGITRSPVCNLFGETLSGLPTIRAFKMQSTFERLNKKVVNENTNMLLTYWCASRWLATRLDLLSVVVIFVVTLYLVATKGQVGSLTSGISITYALMLTSSIQWVMRALDRTDNAMTSVERLLHFRSIPQEASGGSKLSDISSDSNWPSSGAIRFSSLNLRYRDNLPLVLRDVSLEIGAGEKIGICGRTGAGKSSLMIALFRICEFDSGTIVIDGVDISQVNLVQLRRSLAIIPQDPVMFSGSLRENLDPFGEYSDAKIWSVLQQVHMAKAITKWESGLDFIVAERGDNLSVGQRQLLSIGRALLKDTNIVVLDEATANVDSATDSLIQTTIKETFVGKTVLIIAHRINTIMHCDKIAVMDAGQVAEFDAPAELLSRPESMFASLAKRSGH